jgi:mono/diheme cytochrome c family protein
VGRLWAPGLALALTLFAAGCGTGGISEGGDVARGKALFINGESGKPSCGSCHALRDAGTRGIPNYPNLDDAFSSVRRQGMKESTIQQVVRDQIELANPPMPQNLVRGDDADAVAAYVAMCAGWTKDAPCATAAPLPPTTTGATTAETTTAQTTTAATTGTTGTETTAGDAAKGKALYASLGCSGCHTLDGSASAGPTFKGLAGSDSKLDDGRTVPADDAYLLESILDPDKQIVAGFQPGVMSAVIKPGQVSRADALALVAFIKSLK